MASGIVRKILIEIGYIASCAQKIITNIGNLCGKITTVDDCKRMNSRELSVEEDLALCIKWTIGIVLIVGLSALTILVYPLSNAIYRENNKVVEGRFEIPCKLLSVSPHRISKSQTALTLEFRRLDGNGDLEVVSDKMVMDTNAVAIVEKIVYRYPDKTTHTQLRVLKWTSK